MHMERRIDMQKKYMFFDIDGTLTTTERGLKPTITQLTKDTLRELENKGHFLAIATGRPYFMMEEIADEVGIHNVVCNGGNDVYIQGECQIAAPLDHDVALSIVHQCIAKEIAFCVSCDDNLERYAHNDLFAKLIEGEHFLGNLHIQPDFDYGQVKEYKRLFIDQSRVDEIDFHDMMLGTMYGSKYVIVEPEDKYRGIRVLMDILHAPKSDVVVFGDGNNDIRMFQDAPISIAMGNAIDELKEIATFVTHRSDEDGIAHACHHFGWL